MYFSIYVYVYYLKIVHITSDLPPMEGQREGVMGKEYMINNKKCTSFIIAGSVLEFVVMQIQHAEAANEFYQEMPFDALFTWQPLCFIYKPYRCVSLSTMTHCTIVHVDRTTTAHTMYCVKSCSEQTPRTRVKARIARAHVVQNKTRLGFS